MLTLIQVEDLMLQERRRPLEASYTCLNLRHTTKPMGTRAALLDCLMFMHAITWGLSEQFAAQLALIRSLTLRRT